MSQSGSDLFERRLLIVSGKGGVGKSSVAAAIARLAEQRGKSTLLVSADGSPGAAGLMHEEPEFEARPVRGHLSVMRIDKRSSLSEFTRLQLGPVASIAAGPADNALAFIAESAPGVGELLLVGKYAHEVRTGNWDLVVVDAASSGHLLGELSAASNLGEIASIGMVQRETAWVVDLLADPSVTGVVNVTVAEDLAVSETVEFIDRLERETPAPLAAVVINRTRPRIYSRALREEVDGFLAAKDSEVAPAFTDALRWALSRSDTSAAVDRGLRAVLGSETPFFHIPELFEEGLLDAIGFEIDAELETRNR